MSFLKLFEHNKNKNSKKPRNESLISLLIQIKEGDKKLREEFISSYKPFISSVIASIFGKEIDTENSDEYSLGLEAFNNAIDKYDVYADSSFIMFAEQAIKWKLYDYIRKKNKTIKEYPFTYFENEENEAFEETIISSDSLYEFEDKESNEEILLFEKRLSEFGISIMDLADNQPKHKDTIRLCITIARVLATDEELYNKMLKNKSIPRNELLKKVNVHIRTIENHRKLIIATSLIFRSKLENSKMCLNYMVRGDEENG